MTTNMNNNPKSTKIFANDEAAGSIIKRFRLSCFHSKLERWKQKTLALKINRCKKRRRNGKRFGYTFDCNCYCHNIYVLQRRNKPIRVSFPSSLNVRQL